jgi:hypothetical protein
MTGAFAKATGIWLIILVMAILNGLLREKVMAPAIGAELSLPLSGITLSLLVLLVAYFLVPVIGKNNSHVFVLVGLLWVMLTLSFEYLFGHYVLGKSWTEINEVFDIKAGNLFIAVLFTAAFAPWLVARVRGLLCAR